MGRETRFNALTRENSRLQAFLSIIHSYYSVRALKNWLELQRGNNPCNTDQTYTYLKL